MESETIKENMENLEEKKVLQWVFDRGIDDMEMGRELLLKEAFEKITKLGDIRKDEWK